MDSRDVQICNEIEQLLYSAAPHEAKIIVMQADLSDEDDHAQFAFDFVDGIGNESWFTGGANVNRQLLELLVEHRRFFVSKNQPRWKRCKFTVDVEADKYSLELKYE